MAAQAPCAPQARIGVPRKSQAVFAALPGSLHVHFTRPWVSSTAQGAGCWSFSLWDCGPTLQMLSTLVEWDVMGFFSLLVLSAFHFPFSSNGAG